MKSKTLMAIAMSTTFVWAGAAYSHAQKDPSLAPESISAQAGEESFIRDTLDMRTGGYKGWGPMANAASPAAGYEPGPQRAEAERNERAQHLAEVKRARDQVWVANAPLRSDYDNIGATRSQGGGFGRFFSRDK